jgi:hypothetical protein
VHRAIMGARSTYWLERLQSIGGHAEKLQQQQQQQREEVLMLEEPGCVRSEAALQIVLSYMYTGGGKSMKDIDALCCKDPFAVRDLIELSARWWGIKDKLHQSVVQLRSKTLMAGWQSSVPSLNTAWYENWVSAESGSGETAPGHRDEYYQMEGPALPLGGVPFPDVKVRATADDLSPEGRGVFGTEDPEEHFAPHRSGFDESGSDRDEMGGSGVLAHRCLMSVRCPVFRGMLSQGMREESSGVVEISEVSRDGAEGLLKFLYCGSQPNASSASAEGTGVGRGFMLNAVSATDAYVLGKRYMLGRLRELAGTAIMDLFDMEDIESVLGLWTWSHSIQDDRLAVAACWFLRVGFSEDEVARATRAFGMGEEQLQAIVQATGMALLKSK